MNKQRVTAAELLAKFEADPVLKRRRQEQQSRRSELEQILSTDERELVSSLRAVGVKVESVWDLVNTTMSYKAAIPILVAHLEIEHHPRTRQGIVRALITPESNCIAAQKILKHFKQIEDSESELKRLLGAVLVECCAETDLEELVGLANDTSNGAARYFLPLALSRMDGNQVKPTLEAWLTDRDLADSASRALKLIEEDSLRP